MQVCNCKKTKCQGKGASSQYSGSNMFSSLQRQLDWLGYSEPLWVDTRIAEESWINQGRGSVSLRKYCYVSVLVKWGGGGGGGKGCEHRAN
jgi:hypothetical protein